MEMIRLKTNATVTTMLLDSNSITLLKRLAFARKIKPSVVKKLHDNLLDGVPSEAPSILVASDDGKYFVVDGNHRLKAYQKYIKKHPTDKIEARMIVYGQMTDDEIKSLYTEYNLGSKQSKNDFVKAYENNIPITRLMPFTSPYGDKKNGKDTLSFALLVGAYIDATSQTWSGGYPKSNFRFIQDSQSLGVTDAKNMENFFKVMIASFGSVKEKYMVNGKSKTQPFMKSTGLAVFMKLWYDNVPIRTEAEFISAFSKMPKDPVVFEYIKPSGMTATKQAYLQLKNWLNTNTNVKFV